MSEALSLCLAQTLLMPELVTLLHNEHLLCFLLNQDLDVLLSL